MKTMIHGSNNCKQNVDTLVMTKENRTCPKEAIIPASQMAYFLERTGLPLDLAERLKCHLRVVNLHVQKYLEIHRRDKDNFRGQNYLK